MVAFVLYQALSLAAWWHLVAGGLSRTLPPGSGDPGQEVWFLAWLPHALTAGTNPFFSHAIFAPAGVNLLANTSVDLLGLVLWPVTAAAGPVAAFGLACLLAPAVSAVAAYAFCARYVAWRPAAFVGGLCYGFGPFVGTDLRFGHLDLTWLPIPPLIFLALDELLVRRRRRPVTVGVALGLAVCAQFFLSTEMLAVTAVMVAAGLVLAAAAHPRLVLPRLSWAWPGLATAGGLAVALLGYPAWMAVAGPRHISGPVWPYIDRLSATVGASVLPHGELGGVAFISGGNGSYLGVALLLVLGGGGLAYRRSGPLRFALAMVVVAYVASLGYRLHLGSGTTPLPLPAAVLSHLPVLDSVVPERFAALVDLFAGLALALVVDHVRRGAPAAIGGRGQGGRARLAIASCLAVAALATMALVPPWPYPVRHLAGRPAFRSPLLSAPGAPASEPGRARRAAPTATAGRNVVAVYPFAPGAVSDQMVWQARAGFPFDLADGYALVPGHHGAIQSPPPDALWLLLAAATIGTLALPVPPPKRRAVRAALGADGIATVVVLGRRHGSADVLRALTEVLGPPTAGVGSAVVWDIGDRRRPGS